MIIEVFDGQDVLMVNHENEYYPVCSENFNTAWADDICDAMGFGYDRMLFIHQDTRLIFVSYIFSTSSGSTAIDASDVTTVPAGYVLPENGGSLASGGNPLDVLNSFE